MQYASAAVLHNCKFCHPTAQKAGNRFSSNEYTEDEQISSLYQTSRLNRRKPNEPLSIGMKRLMLAIC